jgi:low affinity Fe/Cu permease
MRAADRSASAPLSRTITAQRRAPRRPAAAPCVYPRRKSMRQAKFGHSPSSFREIAFQQSRNPRERASKSVRRVSLRARNLASSIRYPAQEPRHEEKFRHIAESAAHAVGTYWAFLLALLVVIVWALTGPYFNYSDTWQLVINTGTTVVTFLMVFLIQNTQNRESRIVGLKLDELLRGVEGSRTGFVQLDHMSDEDLKLVQQEFTRMRDKYAPLIDDDLALVQRELRARQERR